MAHVVSYPGIDRAILHADDNEVQSRAGDDLDGLHRWYRRNRPSAVLPWRHSAFNRSSEASLVCEVTLQLQVEMSMDKLLHSFPDPTISVFSPSRLFQRRTISVAVEA